jgi:hypothetical protein
VGFIGRKIEQTQKSKVERERVAAEKAAAALAAAKSRAESNLSRQ